MKWMKTADKLPEKDGAYMMTDGIRTVFGTYSLSENLWKPSMDCEMNRILWWKDLPYLPKCSSPKHGDIDEMGHYLYDENHGKGCETDV